MQQEALNIHVGTQQLKGGVPQKSQHSARKGIVGSMGICRTGLSTLCWLVSLLAGVRSRNASESDSARLIVNSHSSSFYRIFSGRQAFVLHLGLHPLENDPFRHISGQHCVNGTILGHFPMGVLTGCNTKACRTVQLK